MRLGYVFRISIRRCFQRHPTAHSRPATISIELSLGKGRRACQTPVREAKQKEDSMALDPQQRAEFVNAYTRALITAWSSEEFAGRLDRDPASALREAGVQLPANAQVVLVRTIPEGTREPSLDKQIALYEQGQAT